VAALRANLRTRYAGRLFVRTFGRLAVRRDSWDGQEIRIEKKRIRALLGALAGHSQEPPTRDALVDMLWPDADADSAVNSLNQTVFQLRRALDSSYRAGESADYVLSSSEQVTLNLELVRTDLSEFERASETLMSGDWAERNAMAHLIARLLRGTFLAELCYEDWASRLQQQVHGRVRQLLLPAADEDGMLEPAIRLELASALIALDPYDEAAVIAMARSMAASGRIVAAQNLMIDYIKKVQDEFDDTPSPGFAAAAEDLTSGDRVKRVLTAARGGPSGA
jgi:DNA-binding SARP family transcriptional activator